MYKGNGNMEWDVPFSRYEIDAGVSAAVILPNNAVHTMQEASQPLAHII